MLAIEIVRRAWSVVERILRRQRERHTLLQLDDRTLRDIGISRDDAVRERLQADVAHIGRDGRIPVSPPGTIR